MVILRILITILILTGCSLDSILGSERDATLAAHRTCGIPPMPPEFLAGVQADRALRYAGADMQMQMALYLHAKKHGKFECVEHIMVPWRLARRQEVADMRMIARQNGFAVPYRISGSGRIY